MEAGQKSADHNFGAEILRTVEGWMGELMGSSFRVLLSFFLWLVSLWTSFYFPQGKT